VESEKVKDETILITEKWQQENKNWNHCLSSANKKEGCRIFSNKRVNFKQSADQGQNMIPLILKRDLEMLRVKYTINPL